MMRDLAHSLIAAFKLRWQDVAEQRISALNFLPALAMRLHTLYSDPWWVLLGGGECGAWTDVRVMVMVMVIFSAL